MTILFPIRLRVTGGTSTFARKFKRGMELRSHRVVFTFRHRYDVLFVSPSVPLPHLLHAKIFRRKIVHRLDGVYYPGTSVGRLWRLHNVPLSIIRRYFADAIVYQSYFSKQSCEQYLWKLSAEGGPASGGQAIIYNGVDTVLFSPEGPTKNLRDNPSQHVFITASRFRREDQIIPILQAFTFYREQYEENSKLVVIGDIASKLMRNLPYATPGVAYGGVVPNSELPAYLRAADCFLFTHRNPPCPNNVIEAMACGLPICGIADGAMPELVQPGASGELLPVFDAAAFARNMNIIMQRPVYYSTHAASYAKKHLDLKIMTKHYFEFIRSIRNLDPKQSANTIA